MYRQPYHVERKTIRDERTGREVWKVSPDNWPCAAPYMYMAAFTPEERFVFYTAKKGKGRQLQRLELSTGSTTPVSETTEHLSWGLHPNGQEVFLTDGTLCKAVDLPTGEARTVLDLSVVDWMERPRGRYVFSGEGNCFAVTYRTPSGGSGIARAACDGSGVESVYVREEGIAHVLFCPAEEDLISFVARPDRQNEMDQPDEVRAHVWMVDAGTGEARIQLLAPQGHRVTHSYWSSDGRRIYYHKKTVPGWTPTSICYADRVSGKETEFFASNSWRLGHSYVTPDERLVVTDTQDPHENPLLLVDVASGEAETLCWPNSANHENQEGYFGNHVHPSFSPSGRFVIYTSDCSGQAQVYIVPLG